jgi:hypothetical protein
MRFKCVLSVRDGHDGYSPWGYKFAFRNKMLNCMDPGGLAAITRILEILSSSREWLVEVFLVYSIT